MEVREERLGGEEELDERGLPVDEEEGYRGQNVLEDGPHGSYAFADSHVGCCGCGCADGEVCETGAEEGEDPGVGEREVGDPEEILGFEGGDGEVAHVVA